MFHNPVGSSVGSNVHSLVEDAAAAVEIDLGYETRRIPLEEHRKPSTKVMLYCLPCFVGNGDEQSSTTSSKAMRALKAHVKTFVFWMTIIQVIMFTTSLVLSKSVIRPRPCVLLRMGAKFTPFIKGKHQVYRLITPALLHGSWIHLVLNLWTQLLMGVRLEYAEDTSYATPKVVAAYFTGVLVGNLLSAILLPQTISIGASSGLAGLIGYRAAILAASWGDTPPARRQRDAIQLGSVLLALLLLGASPGVDSASHGGGLLGGLLLGGLLRISDENQKIMCGGTLFVVLCAGLGMLVSPLASYDPSYLNVCTG